MVLDVNAGVVYNSNPNPNETEPPLMRSMIELVQGLVDVPLCIDSSVPGALEAGLEAANGRPLLNSVTGEEERLEAILPLVKKYNVPWWRSRTTTPGFPKTPRCASPWQEDRRTRRGFRHPGP
jgi:5-methyltetrahydrofolate--homocysteine methyltransferase